MKKFIRYLAAAAVLAVIMVSLSGCMNMSTDELYTLPQLSEGYLQLQRLIDEKLNSGAEYSAPISGANRQVVQLEDIDGDGLREALAFFNFRGEDKPLKIYIFERVGGTYEERALIEGEGSGIDTVAYTDMDGDGVKEIAIGWQIASGMNMLSVYTAKDWQMNQVINTDYTEYVTCDLNPGTSGDILALRMSSSELTCEAELYSMAQDGEMMTSMTHLSQGIESLSRVRTSELTDGNNAVFAESIIDGGNIVTDIIACYNGKLCNVTMDDTTGVSTGTYRTYSVYCRDINGDGVVDVPRPLALPSLTEGAAYYMTDWYSYRTSGKTQRVFTTYTNYSDGWYLILPDNWKGEIAVRREDGATGERAIIFSLIDYNGEIAQDFLAIYALTGENRSERAAYGARFVLLKEEETIYAASILTNLNEFPLELNPNVVRSNFRILYSEWITGET